MGKLSILSWGLIFFAISCIFITIPSIGWDTYTYEEDKALINVNLMAEKVRCINIVTHNTDNLPDFINYERAGSDANAFMIDEYCYSLIHNYNAVYDKAIKEFYKNFYGGLAGAVIFSLVVFGIATLVVYIYRKDNDDDDDNYQGY